MSLNARPTSPTSSPAGFSIAGVFGTTVCVRPPPPTPLWGSVSPGWRGSGPRRFWAGGLASVAAGHRLDGVGQAGDAVVAQHRQALDDDLERADDRHHDEEREAEGGQGREDRRDDDGLAAARGAGV